MSEKTLLAKPIMSNFSANRKHVEKNLKVLDEMSREIGKPSLYYAKKYGDLENMVANAVGTANKTHSQRFVEEFHPLDKRVLAFLPSVTALESTIKALQAELDTLRSTIYKEGGITELKYLEEITDCFAQEKCRVSSEVTNTYDSVSFTLLFPVKEYSVFKEFIGFLENRKLTKHDKERVWFYVQGSERELDYFQREHSIIFNSTQFRNLVTLCKLLNDNLQPLQKRGFNAYLSLEDITSSNAKFKVSVSAAR